MMRKKVLVLASVASMIDQFCMPNIRLLLGMGCGVDVACNFIEGSTCPAAKIDGLKKELGRLGVGAVQIDFARNIFAVRDNLRAYRQTSALMERNRYGFVHCHSPAGGVCGRLAARSAGIKAVYTAHGFHFYRGAPLHYWALFYPAERYLARFTELLITINGEDYARACGFGAGAVVHIPGVGVDIGRFDRARADAAAKRRDLGVPENSYLLLSVGELNANKNHVSVLRAMSLIPDADIHYLVAGRGPLGDYLVRYAEKLGLSGRFRLLGYREDVAELYKTADCFVFPSLREGLPVALMEAAASGLPAICSRIRGNVDILAEDEANIFFRPGDETELAEAVLEMKRRKARGAPKNRLDRKFSEDSVMEKLKTCYEKLLRAD